MEKIFYVIYFILFCYKNKIFEIKNEIIKILFYLKTKFKLPIFSSFKDNMF